MSTKKRTGEDALFESTLSDEVIFYGMVEALISDSPCRRGAAECLYYIEWDVPYSPFYMMFDYQSSIFGGDFWFAREREYQNGWRSDDFIARPKIKGAKDLSPRAIMRLPHPDGDARDSNDWDLSPSAAPLPPREKCYIAGAIGSMPEAEYRPLFEAGAAEARTLGFEPISPIDLPHNHDRSYGSYMKEDLTELLKCKAIYVLRNWRHSPGAKFEIETAVFCGINVIFQ